MLLQICYLEVCQLNLLLYWLLFFKDKVWKILSFKRETYVANLPSVNSISVFRGISFLVQCSYLYFTFMNTLIPCILLHEN